MKKTMLLLACLMTMGVAMTTACGQVSQDSSDSQQSSVVQDSFSISAGNFAAAELGESYTVDLSSVKVTDAGGTASSLTVSVKGNEVKDPSGAAMQLENNAFTPAATGNWTVVLFVEGYPEIAEVIATIEVKDTVGPVIEVKGDFSETAKIGDEIAVPEFTVTDYGSLAGELEVTVTDPEGKAVAVSENKFVVEKVGEYRITAKQKDSAGNEGVCNLTVAGEYDVSQVGLSSYDSIGFEEIWDGYITFNKVTKNDLNPEDQFYGDENYSAKVSIVEGKETKNIRLWMDMEEKDWSEYDYVKFYVYNNTNISLRIALCEDNDNNSLMRPNVGVGEWTPVVIPLTEGAKIASNRVSWVERTWQELNNVETLGLYLTTAEDNNNWSTGNAFKSGDIWFSAMEGGNYKTTDENVLIPVEEGINATNVARIRMINHYNIVESSEQTAPGEAMSLKLYALRDFPAGDNLVITMNGRYYLQAGYAGDVYMWVYNGGKTAVTINAKTAVTLQPGEGKMITFTASEAEIVININSSSMKTGDALYFGNVYKGAAPLSSYDSVGFEGIWDGYITFNKVTRSDLNPEDQFYGDENYSAKVSIVEGKETKNIRLWMDMDYTDWSGYDYIKFYVYNNTNVSLRIALCEDNDNNSLMRPNVGVGEWTPVVIPLTEGAKIASNRVSWDGRVWQELNDVETLGLYLTTAEDNNNWSTGNAFKSGDIWFSAMEGGNYKTTDENVLIPVEEGINATNVARIRMINHYNIVESSEQTAPGEAMSLKLYALRDFPAGDNLVITMNGRYYLQAGYAGDVHMWVYNGGKTAVTINAKTAVTLQPGEGKMITFTASEAEIVININSSSMKTGDALYFGNVYKGAAE